MKAALDFHSPLLKKSIELYFDGNIVSKDESDFIIGDYLSSVDKPVFIIAHDDNSTLKVPFTKEEFLSSLNEFIYKHRQKSQEEQELEKIIDELDKKHKAKIDKLISEYYAKD